MERLARGSSSALPVDEYSARRGQEGDPYNPETTGVGYHFWKSQGITMPSLEPRYIPESTSLAPESMRNDVERFSSHYTKSEPMEQELPSVAGQEPRRQLTGEYNFRRVASPEPMRARKRNVQLIFEDLPYVRYETTRQLDNTSRPAAIYFRVGPGEDGFPLSKALDGDLDTLFGGHEVAPLADASTKLSIRLLFDGCEYYTRQIMARRSTSKCEPISMRALAHKIAKEMKECLAKTHNAGKPLVHRDRVVHLEDLYLWRLVRVSSGSWVPEFKVMMWV